MALDSGHVQHRIITRTGRAAPAGCRPAYLQDGRTGHGKGKGLLYGFPHGRFFRRTAEEAAKAVQGRRDRADRHERQVRRHQDALWRAGQRQLPAPKLCARRGRTRARAGRQAVFDGLQHHVPRQAQKRAGAPGVRVGKRVHAAVRRLPAAHRGRPQGHRRRGRAGRRRRVRQRGAHRPRRHGRGRIHQPDALQGPRGDRLWRGDQEHRHGLRLTRRQEGTAQQRAGARQSGALPRLPPLRARMCKRRARVRCGGRAR